MNEPDGMHVSGGHPAEDAELHCPSVDVCAWCGDSECDGIGCIASLDPNSVGDHEDINHLHDCIRRGKLALQVERYLAQQENRA